MQGQHIVSIVAATIGMGGCLLADVHPVEGTPDDVQTQPGMFDGYRFATPCMVSAQQAVIGTGSIVVGEGIPSKDVDRELEEHGTQIYEDLHGELDSMYGGGGASISCERSPTRGSTLVQLWDWREVDATVTLVGAWLRERDLALEVGILVTEPDGM